MERSIACQQEITFIVLRLFNIFLNNTNIILGDNLI